MTGPQRVQLTGGLYRRVIPAGAVDITRPTRWQNPFPVAEYGRHQALRLYRGWLDGHPDVVALARNRGVRLRLHGQALVDAARQHLAGRDVACWCAPDEECHGDLLLAVVTGTDPLSAPLSQDPGTPKGKGKDATAFNPQLRAIQATLATIDEDQDEWTAAVGDLTHEQLLTQFIPELVGLAIAAGSTGQGRAQLANRLRQIRADIEAQVETRGAPA